MCDSASDGSSLTLPGALAVALERSVGDSPTPRHRPAGGSDGDAATTASAMGDKLSDAVALSHLEIAEAYSVATTLPSPIDGGAGVDDLSDRLGTTQDTLAAPTSNSASPSPTTDDREDDPHGSERDRESRPCPPAAPPSLVPVSTGAEDDRDGDGTGGAPSPRSPTPASTTSTTVAVAPSPTGEAAAAVARARPQPQTQPRSETRSPSVKIFNSEPAAAAGGVGDLGRGGRGDADAIFRTMPASVTGEGKAGTSASSAVALGSSRYTPGALGGLGITGAGSSIHSSGSAPASSRGGTPRREMTYSGSGSGAYAHEGHAYDPPQGLYHDAHAYAYDINVNGNTQRGGVGKTVPQPPRAPDAGPYASRPHGTKAFHVEHAGRVQTFQAGVEEAGGNILASVRAAFRVPQETDVMLLLQGSGIAVAVGWGSLSDGETYTLQVAGRTAGVDGDTRAPPARMSPALYSAIVPTPASHHGHAPPAGSKTKQSPPAPGARIDTPYALPTPNIPFATVETVVQEHRSDVVRRAAWGASRGQAPHYMRTSQVPPADLLGGHHYAAAKAGGAGGDALPHPLGNSYIGGGGGGGSGGPVAVVGDIEGVNPRTLRPRAPPAPTPPPPAAAHAAHTHTGVCHLPGNPFREAEVAGRGGRVGTTATATSPGDQYSHANVAGSPPPPPAGGVGLSPPALSPSGGGLEEAKRRLRIHGTAVPFPSQRSPGGGGAWTAGSAAHRTAPDPRSGSAVSTAASNAGASRGGTSVPGSGGAPGGVPNLEEYPSLHAWVGGGGGASDGEARPHAMTSFERDVNDVWQRSRGGGGGVRATPVPPQSQSPEIVVSPLPAAGGYSQRFQVPPRRGGQSDAGPMRGGGGSGRFALGSPSRDEVDSHAHGPAPAIAMPHKPRLPPQLGGSDAGGGSRSGTPPQNYSSTVSVRSGVGARGWPHAASCANVWGEGCPPPALSSAGPPASRGSTPSTAMAGGDACRRMPTVPMQQHGARFHAGPAISAVLVGTDRYIPGGSAAAAAAQAYLEGGRCRDSSVSASSTSHAHPSLAATSVSAVVARVRVSVLTERAHDAPPTRCNIDDALHDLAVAFAVDDAGSTPRRQDGRNAAAGDAGPPDDLTLFCTPKRRVFMFAGTTVANPAATASLSSDAVRPGSAGYSQALVPFDGKAQCLTDDRLYECLLDPSRGVTPPGVATLLVFDTDRPVLTMPYTLRCAVDGSVVSQEMGGLPLLQPRTLVLGVQYVFTSPDCTALSRTGYLINALVEILGATPDLSCVELLSSLRAVMRDHLPPTVVPLPILGCSTRCSLAEQRFSLQ